MNSPDNSFYITPEQLCVGLYVHLDLNWMEHPFPFSSFRIKNADQLATLQQLGLKRIRFAPERSACKPLPETPRNEGAETPPAAPAAADSDAAKEKRERIEQLNRIKRDIAAVEKEFQQAAETIRNMTRNIHSRPQEVRREAESLVEKMVESILAKGDVMVHAMSEKLGEDAYFHALNVTVLSLILAKALDLGEEESRCLGLGAIFHDIGKIDIPPRILMKTDPLTKSEQSFFEMHCEYGLDIASKAGLPKQAADIVLQHHEFIDGSGYPGKLKGGEISRLSKIVCIVNIYDNLCNPHNIAHAMTPHEALSHMFATMQNRLDAVALQVFIHCMGVYPPGSIVQLSNEMPGLVVSVNSASPLKPNILVYDPEIPKDEAVIVNLERERDLSVSKCLRPGELQSEVYHYLNPRKRVTYYYDPKKRNEPD